LDARRWLPRDPLLSAAARLAAAGALLGSALIVGAGGVLVMHQARAGWFDRSADSWIRAALADHGGLLVAVADLVKPVRLAVVIAVVVLACVAARRLNGALLALLSVPLAAGLTEVLKRLIGRTLHGALVYPSGHTTAAFAFAAVVVVLVLGPSRHVLPFAVRLTMAFAVVLTAGAVALAVIGLNWHYLSDTLAGAAVGVGTVAGASLALDQAHRRASSRAAR
jgi:membrane-associated phospholipid phosphatase